MFRLKPLSTDVQFNVQELVNIALFLTNFNVPVVPLLTLLSKTKNASQYVQPIVFQIAQFVLEIQRPLMPY